MGAAGAWRLDAAGDSGVNVLFRCDGNRDIGAGHLVRCGALAREIMRRGGRAALLCRGIPEELRWAAAGAAVIPLAADGLDAPPGTRGGVCESDPQPLLDVARRWQADWIFVDHYGADANYLGGVWEAGYRLAVLDDAGGRDLRALDLVVNPNLGAESIPYTDEPQPKKAFANAGNCIGPKRQTAPFRARLDFPSGSFCYRFTGVRNEGNSDTRRPAALCLGPAFAALRPEFAAARERLERAGLARRLRRPVEQVFAGFGGSRMGSVAGEIADAIRAWGCPLKVAVASDLDAATVAAAMSGSGLAVSAAGSTVWELCCLGVPSVVWPLADNQRGIAAALGRAGAAVAVDGAAEALAAARELMDSTERRAAMGWAAWELADGRGAERVVNEMERLARGCAGAKVPLTATDSTIGADGMGR